MTEGREKDGEMTEGRRDGEGNDGRRENGQKKEMEGEKKRKSFQGRKEGERNGGKKKRRRREIKAGDVKACRSSISALTQRVAKHVFPQGPLHSNLPSSSTDFEMDTVCWAREHRP